MRCETNHWRGFLVFEQIGERTLIEGCENFACLNQGSQLLEEIGCDYLNLPQKTLLFQSLEDRDAVGRADIQALRFGVTPEQSKGLSVRFLGTFVRFDRRKQAE